MTLREWGMLIALSTLWGGSFLFQGIAVRELPPLTIVFARVALAAAVLWIVILVLGIASGQRTAWRAFLGMGLLNNVVPFSLIVWGQTHVASGVAAILNATTPLFTVLVAHATTADDRITPGRLLGAIIGFTGVATMIGLGALQGLTVGVLAQFGILLAAISYALAGTFGRRFRTLGVGPLAAAAGQVTASSLMLLPLMLIVDRPWTLPPPSSSTIAALAGLALLSTALAYILYFRILATAGATNLLLVTFLIPVSAIALGFLILDESLKGRHYAGMLLISAALAAIDGRPWKIVRRRLEQIGRKGGATSF